MAKKNRCQEVMTLDIESVSDIVLESIPQLTGFIDLTCDRKEGHDKKHRDPITGLRWGDSTPSVINV